MMTLNRGRPTRFDKGQDGPNFGIAQHLAERRLRDEHSRIQYQLGQEVVLRYTPKIKFEVGDPIAEGDRVLSILNELEQELPGEENSK